MSLETYDTHSLRSDVDIWHRIANADDAKLDGAMQRAAKLRKEINDIDKLLAMHFRRIEDSRQECADAGVVMDYQLSAPLAAAQEAWRTAEPEQQNRISIEISEAPMMPVEEEL